MDDEICLVLVIDVLALLRCVSILMPVLAVKAEVMVVVGVVQRTRNFCNINIIISILKKSTGLDIS